MHDTALAAALAYDAMARKAGRLEAGLIFPRGPAATLLRLLAEEADLRPADRNACLAKARLPPLPSPIRCGRCAGCGAARAGQERDAGEAARLREMVAATGRAAEARLARRR